MLNRDPERESPRRLHQTRARAMADSSLANEGLSAFRRAYRWLNLTLVQHGVWPLAVVVFGAPAVPVALTPLPWYWARLAAPVLATCLALAYLAQRPQGLASDMALRTAEATSERDRRLREQATILIIGVATAVAILRVLQGPFIPVLKLEAFGLADTAAYQAINFGWLDAPSRWGPSRRCRSRCLVSPGDCEISSLPRRRRRRRAWRFRSPVAGRWGWRSARSRSVCGAGRVAIWPPPRCSS